MTKSTMTQGHVTPIGLRSVHRGDDPQSPPEGLSSPVDLTLPGTTSEMPAPAIPHPVSTPIRLAMIATVVWMALVVATLIVLFQYKLIVRLDVTNILALGGSICAPLSFIWMVAIAVLRQGPQERARLEAVLRDVMAPLIQMRDEAAALHAQTKMELSRLEQAAQGLDSRVHRLASPLAEHIDRLETSTQRLETAQTTAQASAQDLKAILADIATMAEQVSSRLPEAARSVNHASTEVALHGEHLEQSARSLAQVVSSARDSMAQLLPMLSRVTAQTHDASDTFSLKLGELKDQARETHATLNQVSSQAAHTLDLNRRWVDEHVAALTATIARVEQESLARVKALRQDIGALDEESGARLGALIDTLQHQAQTTQSQVANTLETLKDQWGALLTTADSVAMSVGMRLLDAMARARGVANEAVNAARDASQAIIATTEKTLAHTQTHTKETADRALAALHQRATAFATLAADAHAHARAVREALEVRADAELPRLAAQIIDSLNDSAIDVSKMLSTDIPQEEWKGYISGDRSFFTRKAVRIADRATEHQVTEAIRANPDMQEAAARYLHGFEALLKLGMGSGHNQALSMALLSSDWGKLYIILSRATGRL